MLCEFAHRFPFHLASLLERDRHLRRNFREETATDLLMMGLVGLGSLDINVFFPDEPLTGGDMEWIYAAPHDVDGGTYLRLIIQAKRAKFAQLTPGGYWYYDHLDHGDPKGLQAQTLVNYAASSPDGHATLPLYFFYHPTSAITPSVPGRPDIEGLNVVFANKVAPVVAGGCSRAAKRLGEWRNHFFSLSELLCWPFAFEPSAPPSPPGPNTTSFLIDGTFVGASLSSPFWHPDFVADRLNGLMDRQAGKAEARRPVEPAPIRDDLRRAIAGEMTPKERRRLQRPRAIFSTRLTREDPTYQVNREALRGQRPA